MTTDDLRTRAREAAEGYCGNSIEAEVFVDGALWHAAQQPSREQIARALYRIDYGDGAAEQNAYWYGDHADRILALFDGPVS